MDSKVTLTGKFDQLARKKEQERLAFNRLDPVFAQRQVESILHAKSYELHIPSGWGERFESWAD